MRSRAIAFRQCARLACATLALLALGGGCSEAEESPPPLAIEDDGTRTLAAVLGEEEELSTLQTAFGDAELSGVLDGPASYTLLAPRNSAFAALGDTGDRLLQDEQRPLLVGILRDHLLPGHLTPKAIAQAIAARGGPVTMTTLGGGTVRFSRRGDRIVAASSEGGPEAALVGTAVAANNGVLLPVDAVLLPRRGSGAAAQ